MTLVIEDQYNSPNFTPFHLVPAVWEGYVFTGWKSIAIHHWDSKWSGASWLGTIGTLINPKNQKSAHGVVEGRPGLPGRFAPLIDAGVGCSWANGSALGNTTAYSLEVNPLERDEDYEAAGEAIAIIRSLIGDVPLVGHNSFTPTDCPGDYDLERLDRIARKYSGEIIPGEIVPPEVVPPVTEIPEQPVYEADPHWTMEPGENLTMVAAWCGTDYNTLAHYNQIPDPNVVPVGMWIWPPVGQGTWIVDPGDTLSSIARKNNVTVQALQFANGINDPNLIYPGMRLQVPLSQ